MDSNGMMGRSPGWNGPRVPLSDEVDENERKAAYWAYLDAAAAEGAVVDSASHVADAAEGGHWVRLVSAADADFEALHMRHSIGHSFGKYGAFGEIFSLRSADGLPQATVLFSGGEAVHAREHQNARLSDGNMAELAAFAASMGMTVRAEPSFDLLAWDEAAANTRLDYLHRGPDGIKTFGSVVIAGRATEGMATDLAAALPGGRRFLPEAVGMTDLRASGGDPLHEIVALRHVRDEPTCELDIERLQIAMARAALPGTGPGF